MPGGLSPAQPRWRRGSPRPQAGRPRPGWRHCLAGQAWPGHAVAKQVLRQGRHCRLKGSETLIMVIEVDGEEDVLVYGGDLAARKASRAAADMKVSAATTSVTAAILAQDDGPRRRRMRRICKGPGRGRRHALVVPKVALSMVQYRCWWTPPPSVQVGAVNRRGPTIGCPRAELPLTAS